MLGSPRRTLGVVLGLVAAVPLVAGCGAGGSSRVTVDPSRRPPPPETPPPARDAGTETESTDGSDAKPPAPTAPTAPGYPASIQIGVRVAEVRTEPEEIVLEVGDSLAMGEDVDMVAYDADGAAVRGIRILANVDSRFAVLEGGYIKGVAEGEAELRMAVRVPPSSGTGPPEVRTFAVPVSVVGPPVVAVEIVDPGVRLLAGAVVRLRAQALTAEGGTRRSVEVTWTSDRRRIATVDERGFVRALLPGAVTVAATVGEIEGMWSFEVEENPVVAVDVSGPSRGRTGEVLRYAAVARDGAGAVVEGVPVDFAASSFHTPGAMGASVYPDGAFVAERPGLYRVVAGVAGRSGHILVEVVERGVGQQLVVSGRGLVADRPTSDLWAFTGVDGRDYVYTGTHSGGQRMLVWDVTNPAQPVLTDFVEVDARVVNDVKVNDDATVAVITREGASDRKNGIVLLDLADPAHPVIADTHTKGLTGGVHNVFFAGDILYAVHNGTYDVHILDVSDPGDVEEVGRWGIDRPGKYLHDVWVADGLAYVSYWNDGVHILDVGDGRWGGKPTEPTEVSSFVYEEGNTHAAFPYTNADGHSYLFVGDEIFDCDDCVSRNGHPGDGSRGFVHVLDMGDPESPREVARYEVPEAGAHNLWVEDDRMYVAYYQAGLRVVDVSGELRGDLYRQGREIAWFPTGAPDGHVANAPMAWGPQPLQGPRLRLRPELGAVGGAGGAEDPGARVVIRGPVPPLASVRGGVSLAVAFALLAGSRAMAQSAVHRVYVANESSDLISRVAFTPGGDAVVEREIPVGIMPGDNDGAHGISVSPDGRHWYVTVAHGRPRGYVWKFHAGPDTLVARTRLGHFPATMGITPDGQFILAANFNLHGDMVPSHISVVYTPEMVEVKRIETCLMPHGSRVRRDGQRHYSVCMHSERLVEIDLESFEVSARFDVTPGRERALGGMGGGGRGGEGVVAGGARGVAAERVCGPTWVEPGLGERANRVVYVACNRNGEVLEVDTERWEVSRRFRTGKAPYNLEATPDGRRLIATLKAEQAVAVFDLARGAEIGRLETSRPVAHGVVASPDGRYAFVSNESVGAVRGTLDVIDLQSLAVVATVELEHQPGGIDIWPRPSASGGPR